MAFPVTDWRGVYAPLIGRTIEAVVWMPMTSDTPQLLAEYREPAFSFTGAVFLAFEGGGQLFLTWAQEGQSMALDAGLELAWVKYALDRVRVCAEAPWGEVEGAELADVQLFTAPFIDGERAVGVRHVLRRDGREIVFWVGTGGADFVGDMDDLWVGVGREPPNFSELIPVARLA